MAGILRCGLYIPYRRLAKNEIGSAWGGRRPAGEKSVAGYDEDSITLAVAAARECLVGVDRSAIDGLFFASTTAPYGEKQSASIVAAALNLREDVLTADLCNCLRSGSTALRLATQSIEAGAASTILVVCADTRLSKPGSPLEADLGDAAAAFLVAGRGDAAAAIEGFVSSSTPMYDVWRTSDERWLHSWEDRWVRQRGLIETASIAARRVLRERNTSPERIDRAVLYAADEAGHKALAKAIGLEYGRQVAPSLIDRIGSCGTAHLPLLLASVLESAGPGETILAVGYGDGADAFLVRTTEQIELVRPARGRGLAYYLDRRKSLLQGYERYLWHKGLVDVHPPPALLVGSSATVLWRESSQILGLCGSRCRRCGASAFPAQRVCHSCHAKDDFDSVPLADQKGRLFTFTLDYLAGQVEPPLIQSVVDMENGSRVYTSMTDADPSEVRVGMDVEMTFRRIRKAEGFYNYFWKCAPVRR